MERVGGEKPINVDVRIVAATHCDLASMVAEGKFREDLWYRIAVFPIVLPPLRERREDIARLAPHFAERAATRFGLAPVVPTAEDLALLATYSWPGNVRELAAVIDRAAILGDGKRLEVATALGVGGLPQKAATGGRAQPSAVTDDRPTRWGGGAASGGWGGSSTPGWGGSSTAAPTDPDAPAAIGPLDDAIRQHIQAALRLTRGRIEGRQAPPPCCT